MADATWRTAISEVVDPRGALVADIGCGGGVYTAAWANLGARAVIAVDFSDEMLTAAREANADRANITFHHGDAAATGLPSNCADIVFERALLHHVGSVTAVLAEARRLLRAPGTYIIQDRCADDVTQQATADHPRGYLFECYPWLLDVELRRRPDRAQLSRALAEAGFTKVHTKALWETRAVHDSRDAYIREIRSRRGRSILYELDDDQLEQFADHLARCLPDGPVVERDRWTLWVAVAPR